MRSLNRIVVVGRLGRDPETRTSAGGTPWGSLSVATSRGRREGDTWVEDTDWHTVRIFGRDAEFAQRQLHRGDLVAVEGSVQYDKWTTADGEKRVSTRIVADRLHLIATAPARAATSSGALRCAPGLPEPLDPSGPGGSAGSSGDGSRIRRSRDGGRTHTWPAPRYWTFARRRPTARRS
jgi:single-strand DNA-binding protein